VAAGGDEPTTAPHLWTTTPEEDTRLDDDDPLRALDPISLLEDPLVSFSFFALSTPKTTPPARRRRPKTNAADDETTDANTQQRF
jgi:hypothetical protein